MTSNQPSNETSTDTFIDASSLGSAAVRSLRERTPVEKARAVRKQADAQGETHDRYLLAASDDPMVTIAVAPNLTAASRQAPTEQRIAQEAPSETKGASLPRAADSAIARDRQQPDHGREPLPSVSAMTAIVDTDRAGAEMLHSALGPETVVLTSLEALRHHLETNPDDDVVVLSSAVDLYSALALAKSLRVSRPSLGVILLRRRVDTSVLHEALRAGVREVVDERDLGAVTTAVRRARAVGRAMREQSGGAAAQNGRRHGRIVTVFSAKGGCGKTTLATNLGVALAERGQRNVCIVDLDLAFGDVAIALGLRPARTIADAVPLADSIDGPTVISLLTTHSPGVKTLAAPLEPGLADSVPTDLVSRVLVLLREQFDYVVVDTPPAFTEHVLAIFDQTDVLALIATLDIPALKNLNLTLETLRLLNYSPKQWRVVINRADSKVGLLLSEVENSLKIPIVGRIPSSRDVPTSINRGKPIVLEKPRHPVSASIVKFAHDHVAAVTSPNGSWDPDKKRRRR